MQKKEVAHFISFSVIASFLFARYFPKIHFLLRFVSSDFLNLMEYLLVESILFMVDQLYFKVLF